MSVDPALEDLEAEIVAELEREDGRRTGASPGPKLTEAQWREACEMWRSGRFTLSQIARRFSIRVDGLQKRLKAAGIVKGSAATEPAPQDPAKDLAAQRIGETKEQHYQYADALAKLVMETVITAKRKNQPFERVDRSLGALMKAAKTLQIVRSERYTLLGLDRDDLVDPEEMPELMVSELTAEQLEELRRQTEESLATDEDGEYGDEDGDDGIVVT